MHEVVALDRSLDKLLGDKEDLFKELKREGSMGLLSDQNLPLFVSRISLVLHQIVKKRPELLVPLHQALAKWETFSLFLSNSIPSSLVEAIRSENNLYLELAFFSDLEEYLIPRLQKDIYLRFLLEAEKKFVKDFQKFLENLLSHYRDDQALREEEKKEFDLKVEVFLKEYLEQPLPPVLHAQLKWYLRYQTDCDDPEEEQGSFNENQMGRGSGLRWSLFQMREGSWSSRDSWHRDSSLQEALVKQFPELKMDVPIPSSPFPLVGETFIGRSSDSVCKRLEKELGSRCVRFHQIFEARQTVEIWRRRFHRYFLLPPVLQERLDPTELGVIKSSKFAELCEHLFPGTPFNRMEDYVGAIRKEFGKKPQIASNKGDEFKALLELTELAVQCSNWDAVLILVRVALIRENQPREAQKVQLKEQFSELALRDRNSEIEAKKKVIFMEFLRKLKALVDNKLNQNFSKLTLETFRECLPEALKLVRGLFGAREISILYVLRCLASLAFEFEVIRDFLTYQNKSTFEEYCEMESWKTLVYFRVVYLKNPEQSDLLRYTLDQLRKEADPQEVLRWFIFLLEEGLDPWHRLEGFPSTMNTLEDLFQKKGWAVCKPFYEAVLTYSSINPPGNSNFVNVAQRTGLPGIQEFIAAYQELLNFQQELLKKINKPQSSWRVWFTDTRNEFKELEDFVRVVHSGRKVLAMPIFQNLKEFFSEITRSTLCTFSYSSRSLFIEFNEQFEMACKNSTQIGP